MRKAMFAKSAATLAITAIFSTAAFAVDSFDASTNFLTLDSVTMNGVTYKNVAATVSSYSLLGVGSGAPAGDTFDPATNTLVLGSVAYQGTVYNNVTVKINAYSLRSVAGTSTPGTLPAPTYTGEMAGYLNTLNNYRTQCGIPALTQNTVLDAAAPAVGKSSTVRGQTIATNAGYTMPSTVGGIDSDYWSNSTNLAAVGQYQVLTALMDAYAMLTLMRPYQEIGMFYQVQKAGSVHQRGAQVMLGNPVTRNTPLPVTFPCTNTTDIPPTMPLSTGGTYTVTTPEIGKFTHNTAGADRKGTPITVFANVGEALVITGASVTAQGGDAVSLQIVDGTTTSLSLNYAGQIDGLMYTNEAYLLPQTPLQPNTPYNVVIYGTINGAAFNKNFTFRTGAAIPVWFP